MKNLEEQLVRIKKLKNVALASFGGSLFCSAGALYTHNPKYLIGTGILFATGIVFDGLRANALYNYRKNNSYNPQEDSKD